MLAGIVCNRNPLEESRTLVFLRVRDWVPRAIPPPETRTVAGRHLSHNISVWNGVSRRPSPGSRWRREKMLADASELKSMRGQERAGQSGKAGNYGKGYRASGFPKTRD